jgi:tetratricopeptide (TPR) repeat protein
MLLWLEAERKIGTLLDLRSDSVGATAVLSRAVAVADKLPPEQRDQKSLRQSVASMYMILSRATAHADLTQARKYAARCLQGFESLSQSYPDDADLLYDLSRAYVQAGFVVLSMGDPEATAPYYEKAMRLRERLVEGHPSDMLYRRSLLLMYQHYGAIQGSPLLLANLDRPDLARLYFGKAAALYESGPHDPHDLTGLADYGALLVRLGAVETPPETPAHSLATLRRATEVLESVGAARGDLSPNATSLATGYLWMGHRLTEMRRYSDAVSQYRRALDIAAPVLQKLPNDREVLKTSIDAQCGLSNTLALGGHRVEALRESQALIAETSSDAARNAQAYVCAARVHGSLREWEVARAAARNALSRIDPLVTGRRGDPNTAVARQAKSLLAEFDSK